MNWVPLLILLLSGAISSCAVSIDPIDPGNNYIGRTAESIVSEFGVPAEATLIRPIAPLGKEYTQQLTYYFRSADGIVRPFKFWVQNGRVTTHEEIERSARMHIVTANSSNNIEAIIESQKN